MQMAREVESVLLAELGSGGGVTDVAKAADLVPGTGVTAAARTVAVVEVASVAAMVAVGLTAALMVAVVAAEEATVAVVVVATMVVAAVMAAWKVTAMAVVMASAATAAVAVVEEIVMARLAADYNRYSLQLWYTLPHHARICAACQLRLTRGRQSRRCRSQDLCLSWQAAPHLSTTGMETSQHGQTLWYGRRLLRSQLGCRCCSNKAKTCSRHQSGMALLRRPLYGGHTLRPST